MTDKPSADGEYIPRSVRNSGQTNRKTWFCPTCAFAFPTQADCWPELFQVGDSHCIECVTVNDEIVGRLESLAASWERQTNWRDERPGPDKYANDLRELAEDVDDE